jgi:ABC-type phosphate transport system ATPase subunit
LTRRNRAVEDVVVEVAGRGVKVVLATHDLGEARRLAGKVVFMVRGRARESAPATSFFDRLLPKRKPLSTATRHLINPPPRYPHTGSEATRRYRSLELSAPGW